jgi:membrane-bound lytic murein transglycosylase B
MNQKTSIFLTVCFVSALVVSGFFVVQQQVFAESEQEKEREELEAELAELEVQIGLIEGDITKTQAEKDSLTNEIYILRKRIQKLNLQVEQSSILIGDLRGQIVDTTSSIEKTSEEIETLKSQVGNVLQRVYEEDHKSRLEIVFAGETLSDFFSQVAALSALSTRLESLLVNMEELNQSLSAQKGALENEKESEENFVKIQLLQKQENQSLQGQTQSLLEQTRGREAEYQRLLANKQAEAQKIRSRIFELIGVPDAPTFGEALEIAQGVSAQTGVRAALLLAVLTQESNLGKNVGQCYLTNTITGAGESVRGTAFSNVMKPSRDVEPFLQITKDLGRDPFQTAVSCPIPSVGGYGGAMGPAQFIPSTWILYKSRLDGMLGKAADPWNIKHAFLASGLLLADGGASSQTYEGEWCAAQRYFSGRCSNRYRFYGDSVLSLAAKYEKDIQTLADAN